MPLVCTALLLEGGKERPQGGDEPLRVLAGDVVARLDLDDLQARVGGLHFLHRLGGVEIGARAAHGEQRAAHFADQTVQKMQRSEEHTSELQSQSNLVCRLLLEKKKKNYPRAD